MMGHTEALQLLERTLEEEKNADRKLNKLAEGGVNALAKRDGQEHMGDGNGGSTRRQAAKSGKSRARH